MANYPIKMLIDEQGQEFVPFVNTDVVYFPDGSTLSNALDTKADKTTLAADKAELQANIDKKADKATTLAGYNIGDAYTKTQIDTKIADAISSVYRYKGSVNTYADLPTTNLTVGDVYDIINADETHEAGSNYVWTGSGWDKLGMTIDYSKLQTVEDATTQHQNLQDQIDTKLETTNIKAGENLQVSTSGRDVTLNTKIADDLKTTDAHTSLSANQGVVLAGRVAPAGGQTNQVLAKVSDSNYDMAWVKAADPNSIIGDGSIVKIVEVTYDEYLELQDAGQIDPDVEYHIADYDGDNISTIGETAIQTMIDRSIQDHVTADIESQAQPVHAVATTSTAGFMSANDKTKLDSVSLNAVSKADLASELSAIVPEATIDSKIETATKDFISETAIDTKINTATSDLTSTTEVQKMITDSTKDFVTNTEAQALVNNGVADKITTTAAQTMVDNKAANYLPLSGGTLSDMLTSPYNNFVQMGNEFNFIPTNNSKNNLYFNYKSGNKDRSNTTTQVPNYYFCDGQGQYNTVTLHAKAFDGLAAKATSDGNGNNIAATYKMKGDFAIIEVDVTPTGDGAAIGSASVPFPTGFTADNCVVISAMYYDNSVFKVYVDGYIPENEYSMGTLHSIMVLLGKYDGTDDSTINIQLQGNGFAIDGVPYHARIVLMKI